MTVLLLLPSPVVQQQPGRLGKTSIWAQESPVPGISLLTFVLKLKVKKRNPASENASYLNASNSRILPPQIQAWPVFEKSNASNSRILLPPPPFYCYYYCYPYFLAQSG